MSSFQDCNWQVTSVTSETNRKMRGSFAFCNNLTKCTCLKCKSFICNKGAEYFVPTLEEFLGWKAVSVVALWKECDRKGMHASSMKTCIEEMSNVDM